MFDKDDERACDALLMDILSVDEEATEGFLSLLGDVSGGGHGPSPHDALGSLGNFVKQEIEF